MYNWLLISELHSKDWLNRNRSMIKLLVCTFPSTISSAVTDKECVLIVTNTFEIKHSPMVHRARTTLEGDPFSV